MPRWPVVSPEVKAAALERARRQEIPSAIAKDIGVSSWTLYDWMNKAGIPARCPHRPLRVRRQAVARVDAGESCTQVAHDIGVRPDTVRRWRREAKSRLDRLNKTRMQAGPMEASHAHA